MDGNGTRRQTYFNPRSPCGERLFFADYNFFFLIFQSTLPMRGAAAEFEEYIKHTGNFNPRSPCGERLPQELIVTLSFDFNPRSPCGERPLS